MPYLNWSQSKSITELNEWYLWTDFVDHFRKLRIKSFVEDLAGVRAHVLSFSSKRVHFSVSKRLPENVVYINISQEVMRDITGLLCATDIPKALLWFELSKAKEDYYKSLQSILTIIDITNAAQLYEYGCADRDTFERKFSLTWVDAP